MEAEAGPETISAIDLEPKLPSADSTGSSSDQSVQMVFHMTDAAVSKSVTFCAALEEIELGINDPPSSAERVITDEDLFLAKTLVTDARDGHYSEYKTDPKSVRLYSLYHTWWLKFLLYLVVSLHHMIIIFEDPALEGLSLHYGATMGMEIAFLLFYIGRLIHCASFLPPVRFWRDKKNVVILVVMFLTAVDMACYIGMVNSGYEVYAYRWSRPLRPIFMVNFSENKQVRRAFRNIRKTLPDILNVLILFLLSISLFALMAQKMFHKRSLKFPNGDPYFTNYFDIYFDLYVLVTTANNPDIMMPAFDLSRWFAVFFIVYLIICLYIFMNIFLAVVYNNYRKHLKNEVRKIVYMKRKSLSRAFDILKVKFEDKFAVSYHRFCVLMKAIYPTQSAMMTSILWFVLDSEGINKVGKADFMQLADLLNVGVSEIKDRTTIFEYLWPNCYRSKASRFFRKLVAHRYFRYVFDIMILFNAFLIALDISDAEWFFLAAFSFEIAVKLYTFGIVLFLKRFWNVFDILVIGAAVIATALESSLDKDMENRTRTLDFLLVLRVLRLVKIIGGIERFQVIVVTIMNLGPSILTYGGVLFVVYYVFAVIGMEIFQHKISFYGYGNITNTSQLFCGNLRLNGSIFYQSHYCGNNFNDILSSFVVLFELMVVNQWHVLANGFVRVTSKVARLYFFLFHLTCVIIVLNIFTAFVLEAFILEYSFCKSKLENAMEKKIMEMGLRLGRSKSSSSPSPDKDQLVDEEKEEEMFDSDHDFTEEPEVTVTEQESAHGLPDLSRKTDIRFHISKKKNVESLLQRMFENELDVDDVGPDDMEDDEDSPSSQVSVS